MARCEDFPCCGHEAGCCPDYDGSGRQLNMKCVCGATVPLGSPSSLCAACLVSDDWSHDDVYFECDDEMLGEGEQTVVGFFPFEDE